MKIDDMERLWPLAKLIHESRIKLCWGTAHARDVFPEFSSAYPHNPIPYVDMALTAAEVAEVYFEARLCNNS